jgi:hypothetical protein
VSYRTSDPLHAAIGVVLGLFGVAASVIAAGSWWYTLHRETTFEMIMISVIPTVIGLALIGFAGWVFVDIVRVRREERGPGHTSRS